MRKEQALLRDLADHVTGLELLARILDASGYTADQDNPNVSAALKTWAKQAREAVTEFLPGDRVAFTEDMAEKRNIAPGTVGVVTRTAAEGAVLLVEVDHEPVVTMRSSLRLA